MIYRVVVTSTALYGCESWSVKADMERLLRSQQTQHCARMLGVKLPRQIREHISAADMRRGMGMKNVLTTMRELQLNWMGRMRRMPMDRTPRQLLVSWMPDSRLRNYNQTYSRTMKKALESIGIYNEADWPLLSKNAMEWSHYTRQTAEDRSNLMDFCNITREKIIEHRNRFYPGQGVVGERRSEYLLCGGTFTPLPPDV